MPRLKNERHEQMCHKVVFEGMTRRQAYKAVGYKGVRNAEARAFQEPGVMARLHELQFQVDEKLAENIAWSRQKILQELEKNVEQAREGYALISREGKDTGHRRRDCNSVNRALELYGKELGMFVDKLVIGNQADQLLDKLNDMQIALLQGFMEIIERVGEEEKAILEEAYGRVRANNAVSVEGRINSHQAPAIPAVSEAT